MSPVAEVEALVRADEYRAAVRAVRCVDRDRLSQAVCRKIEEEGPLVLSELFMRFWCGVAQPPEELGLWLEDRGFEIFPNIDTRPGYRVQKRGERIQVGLWG